MLCGSAPFRVSSMPLRRKRAPCGIGSNRLSTNTWGNRSRRMRCASSNLSISCWRATRSSVRSWSMSGANGARRHFRSHLAHAAALGLTRVAALSFGTIAGGARLHRGLHLRKSLRGAGLYTSLHRPNPKPCAKVVQHGDLRQSSKASRAPEARAKSTKAVGATRGWSIRWGQPIS
jgi:hypothetical protein